MGFLSKLMKNPLVQMALPMMLTGGASSLFSGAGMLGGSKLGLGLGSMFSKMNPMMANALKQSMLGYGTAALSGSRRPGRAAMTAGLTSIPFSYMSAANAAKGFNEQYGDMRGMEKYSMEPGYRKLGYVDPDPASDIFSGGQRFTGQTVDPVMGFKKMQADALGASVPKVTPMDILKGKYKEGINLPPKYMEMDPLETGGTYTNVGGESFYGDVVPGKNIPMDADIFSKPEYETIKVGDDVMRVPTGKFKTDFLPTAVSQAAGLYAGRDTPEEEWEAARKKRKKELAWMYGVDEDQIEGEMDNPFYTGAFMNTGGLASLNMDMGGGVSGPGGPKDDMIDAKLSDGEFVMTAKAVENLGGGDRMAGARKMYSMMNMLDPESEAMSEVV